MTKRNVWRLSMLVVIAIALIAGGFLLHSRSSSGGEPSQRVEVYATGPAGQPGPVNVIVPNYPDDPGTPTIAGPFRLLPFGFSDRSPVSLSSWTPCARPEAQAHNNAAIEASELYVDVGYVPPSFSRADAEASSICGADIVQLRWRFPGKLASTIEIVRGKPPPPIDVRVPAPESWYTLEVSSIEGQPAVITKLKPDRHGPSSVYMFDGEILTLISGDVADDSELIKVAESLK